MDRGPAPRRGPEARRGQLVLGRDRKSSRAHVHRAGLASVQMWHWGTEFLKEEKSVGCRPGSRCGWAAAPCTDSPSQAMRTLAVLWLSGCQCLHKMMRCPCSNLGPGHPAQARARLRAPASTPLPQPPTPTAPAYSLGLGSPAVGPAYGGSCGVWPLVADFSPVCQASGLRGCQGFAPC